MTAAPCQEVILEGDDLRGEGCGLDALLIPVSTPGFDAAPYITAGLWISKDPDDGVQNMGMYRGQLKAPDRPGVMMLRSLSAGGYFHWKKYRDRGEKMPVAVVLGAPPVVTFAGPQKLKLGVDELGVAGGLAGGPVNVIRAKTSDLLVPAEAEVVIEGRVHTRKLEPEGPFGESHGYVALEEYNIIVEVTAITRRRQAVIPSIISQVTPSESSVIKRVAYEPMYLNHLRSVLGIPGVVRVALHEPLTKLRRIVFVQFERGVDKTEIWRALYGTAALMPAVGEYVIAINEDIDPDNGDAVFWALGYRANPDLDVQVLKHRARGHGPVLKHAESDATLKADMPPVALPKREYMESARTLWEKLGLPPLKPEPPWHGYSLGEWNETWALRREVEEPQTPVPGASADENLTS